MCIHGICTESMALTYSLSPSLSLYIYILIHTGIFYVYIYIYAHYIYTHIHIDVHNIPEMPEALLKLKPSRLFRSCARLPKRLASC